MDLLAGDTDGFIWWFRNIGSAFFPEFDPRGRLQAARGPLSVAGSGGHARFDVCDWNNDGRKDLVVADGSGTVTLFLNHGTKGRPALSAGEPLSAGGKPIHIGSRASALACDWNKDGRKDLLLADDHGYCICRNKGADAAPILDPPVPILFGGKPVKYIRPNLGSFVDWDGDGALDLLSGQGHDGSGLRFFDRHWIEDPSRGATGVMKILAVETNPRSRW